MEQKLYGVFAPITTPFDDKGDVSYDNLKENMIFYTESKLRGYFVLGSNGENKSLTNKEKEKVLKTVLKNKKGDKVVIAGCIHESTKETIEFAKLEEYFGADFISLLSPSYFKKQMTDEILLKYFTDVADSVKIPCLVYNAPQFSGGITLNVSLIRDLSKHPNIIGMKDSSIGNIEKFLFAVRDEFNVMAGSANFFMNALLLGAVGGVISLANVFPDLICMLYNFTISKQYEKAFMLNEKIFELNNMISGKGGVAAVKYAMDLVGLYGGKPRLPLMPLKDEDKELIRKVLEKERKLWGKC